MNAKKCDRCGAYYDKNKKHKTFGRISGGVISGIWMVDRNGTNERRFDLCDDCIGDLKEFLNIKEPDEE